MNITVVGAEGQLGAAVVHELKAAHQVTALAHADLDITDDRAVSRVIGALRPGAVINAASFNAVDRAEDEPVAALDTNAFGVRALAKAAGAIDAMLVHYSSDFVFDGAATEPYGESDRPHPHSVYAASKLLGEWFAADNPRSYVLRVESLFGRAPGSRPARGSVATMLTRMRAGDEVPVFEDRTVSPTYVVDAAAATRQVLERGIEPGLYHCVNSGSCTWVEFARELGRLLDVKPTLVPIRLDQLNLRAVRPAYCAMSNAKLAAAGIRMPAWQDALRRFVDAMPSDERGGG
jgi:dTDP-4-dehydrorhamnose reductase